MAVRLIRFLLGFVKFKIIGEYPERLINQLALNGIRVWGITRSKSGLSAYTFMKDYKKIRRIRAENRVRTRIVKRFGLPVALKRHSIRAGFAVGFALYIAVLLVMSGFVWNIRVVGNSTLTEAEILSACKELGLHEGVPKSSVDSKEFRTRLLLELDGIAWASVNIEGVRATVNISEARPPKNDPPENCNLVASADGIITAIESTSGTVKVKVGQTVKKGDLLVSGITEYKDGTYRFGVAKGEIYAATERVIEHFVPFETAETVRDGTAVTKRVLTVFGLNIPLYLGTQKGSYETETLTKRYEKDGMYLPVALTETTFYGLKERQTVLTEAEAKEKAAAELEEIIAQELENAEITQKSLDFILKPDGISVIAKINCKENIAETDLLLILS